MNLRASRKKLFLLLGSCALLSFTANAQQSKSQVNQHTTTHQNLIAAQGDIKKEIELVDSLMMSYSIAKEQMDIVPAMDLYGDVWNNQRVNPYGGGALPDSLIIDCSEYSMPVPDTYITSNYGPRGRRYHYGTDLKVQIGDTIYAAFSGKVRMCKFEKKGYGYYVVLRHHNGFETVYGHLSGFLVEEGDMVEVGQPIALGGNTGRSTGPHLHFEVRVKGQPINPAEVFDFKNQVAHADTYVFSGKKAAATKANATKYAAGSVKYYKVKQGDTLSKIAKRHGISVAQLCKLNNISTKKTLKVGQRLRCS
ncbi:MAG: peptidoglycan DD-metalloendopeptidase family protein [Candidatus Azobacteroides sp.]|nr:peptidoglycan DD-metalloendopeptidase family protein [Candidatus Azobacteroides sp.]